jgi:dienelactone hydrolase
MTAQRKLPALPIILLLCCTGLAQVPEQDSRNTNIPGTDTHFSMPHYASRADWEARKAHLRRQILSAAGLFPMPERTPLHPQIFGRIERGGYSIEKVLLETLPGYYLGGNLYRPIGRSSKLPAVLNPHGHWPYGRLENEPVDSNPSFGITLARQGYVVFAWDMVGYNDTVQTPHSFGNPTEQLWSFGPLALQLWNSTRALDFVLSLDVDPARVGIAGASGGATQTLLLAAVDDRLQYAAPANMVSFLMQGGDTCENAPGLRLGTNNVEIASMFAPKPMLMTAATGDWTHDMMKAELPAVREIYSLYDAPDNVNAFIQDAPHNFNKENREQVYRFFGTHVLKEPRDASYVEKNVHIEKLQDMLALAGRSLNANALTYSQLFSEWRQISLRQFETVKSRGELQERLRAVLASQWPDKVLVEQKQDRVVLSRPGAGDRVPGIWLDGRGDPVLVVHPEGAAAALKSPNVEELRKLGRPILLIDAFQTGSAVAPRDRSGRHFLTFNQSDDACRVQDILTALSFLQSRYKGKIELLGMGTAGVWATFAAAVAPIPLDLRAALGTFRGTDDDFLRMFDVPGIQRAGGLAAAERLKRGF